MSFYFVIGFSLISIIQASQVQLYAQTSSSLRLTIVITDDFENSSSLIINREFNETELKGATSFVLISILTENENSILNNYIKWEAESGIAESPEFADTLGVLLNDQNINLESPSNQLTAFYYEQFKVIMEYN